jgi:hypothetical protein
MANATDAQALMQLYDLRRESEMRKARSWFGAEFNPTSADDALALIADMRSDANRYFRMVTSYWEFAAGMVLHGALNEEMFMDTQQEMFFVFAKVYPFLPAIREKMRTQEAFGKMEKLINKSEAGKKKLQDFIQRIEQMRTMMAAAAKK